MSSAIDRISHSQRWLGSRAFKSGRVKMLDEGMDWDVYQADESRAWKTKKKKKRQNRIDKRRNKDKKHDVELPSSSDKVLR